MKQEKMKLSNQSPDTNQQLEGQMALKKDSVKEWVHILSRYKKPNHLRSVFEIAVTSIPLIFLWLMAVYFYKQSYFLSLVFIIPSALFLVRLFCIQHDCGHGTFFRHKKINDWVGRIIGILTFTPYELWRKDHATHHSNSGNLQQRGIGDVTTLTLEEYKNLSFIKKINYRIYRTPLVMFFFRTRLFVYSPLSPSPWSHERSQVLDQHHGNQFVHWNFSSDSSLHNWSGGFFSRPYAHLFTCGGHWSLDVLHPTPV